ncbi:MAG: CHASE2 domain-containing protein [Candidatus Rokubacteria bacterium]|nr:CHASE2 domain-containing protein [Candidatus Rokubacteria bacterium]
MNPGPGSGAAAGRARPRASARARLALALACTLGAWVIQFGPAGQTIERKGLDLLFLLRGVLPGPDDLVVVSIDEPSFAELGAQWPWPRTLHARLTDRLRALGARVIAFDILFSEPSVPAEDRALAAAIERAGNVILASDLQVVETAAFRQVLPLRPLPELERHAAGVGLVALVPDRDAVIRALPAPSAAGLPFAHVVARAAGWRGSGISEPLLINYLGPPPAVRTVSYVQALLPDRLPAGALRGKVVLVGRAHGPHPEPQRPLPDAYVTPFFWSGRHFTPGVEVHATIVDTLLRDRGIRAVHPLAVLGWAVAGSLAAAALLARLAWWAGLAALGGLVAVQAGLALGLFAGARLWLPWVLPALGLGGVYGGTLVVRWRQSEREKAFVQRAFQHYVHPVVVRQILEDPSRLRLGGDLIEATVLFSDLQGFTKISEGLRADALVALLNEYLSAMAEEILRHRGMLNRTIGDAILALWGVPLPDTAHAVGACRAALGMHRRLAELNRAWAAAGRPVLRMRIGVYTGPMVVGNVGTADRFDYTALGDTVNLASRLEAINKLYGTGIVVGEETVRQVGDGLEFRELDRIRVVGRSQPVQIYECLGEPSARESALLEAFRLGLAAYAARDFKRAGEYFQRALAQAPEDGPSQLYLERVQRFRVEPPPADWDGVATMTSKEG